MQNWSCNTRPRNQKKNGTLDFRPTVIDLELGCGEVHQNWGIYESCILYRCFLQHQSIFTILYYSPPANCQVTISRFYWTYFPPLPSLPPFLPSSFPQLLTPDLRGTAGPQLRTPDHSDPNCELQITVGTDGPQLRAPDVSGHCRTSTSSARSQRALPDLNRERQISQPRAPEQTECQTECHNICQVECQKGR